MYKKRREKYTCTARRGRIFLQILELLEDPFRSHGDGERKRNREEADTGAETEENREENIYVI